jgi:hypothetical protein
MAAYYRGEIELCHGYPQSMNELVRNETTRSVLRPKGGLGPHCLPQFARAEPHRDARALIGTA